MCQYGWRGKISIDRGAKGIEATFWKIGKKEKGQMTSKVYE